MSRNKALMRRQSIVEAMADKSPHLFVMNRVSEDPKFVAGNINLNVKSDDGMTVIVIPATFIPVDMGLFIDRDALLRNQAFRRLDASDKISIINPEDALNAIASNPRAQKEVKRILNINNDHGGSMKAGGEELIEMKASREGGSGDTNLAPLQNVNPFAIGIVQRAQTEDVADLIADIESRAHTLEISDLEYIAQNVEDNTLKQFVVEYVTSN